VAPEFGVDVEMWSEFRAFLQKTNALALAIGVIIGAALGTVVTSLVNDIIMPPIGVALGGVDFRSLSIRLKDATATAPEVAIRYGVFINAVITFIVIAFVVFWISRSLVKPAPEEPTPELKQCPFCKESVFRAATKCRYCGSEI
jgi:large conductance mechanosensitive channel